MVGARPSGGATDGGSSIGAVAATTDDEDSGSKGYGGHHRLSVGSRRPIAAPIAADGRGTAREEGSRRILGAEAPRDSWLQGRLARLATGSTHHIST